MKSIFSITYLVVKVVRLFFVILLFCEASFANKPAEMIEQNSWIAQFEMFYGTSFCGRKDFLNTCLNISVSECKSQIKNLIKPCAQEVNIPQKIALGPQSELYGQKIGRCVARKILPVTQQNKIISSKKMDPKCTIL